MKHFLVAFLLPMTLTAQSMQQLTEQLGKTVLYGDLALSPDGARIAWVQSTAATTLKQTYFREVSGNATPQLVNLPMTSERTDSDLAWSPDSKTLGFFSSAGPKEQRQLWLVDVNGSGPKKITNLNGYAARPDGAYVITTASQRSFEFLTGLGADEVIDYHTECFEQRVQH